MTIKTYLITGTSSGFGRLMTERLLARGDRVVATLRRPGALDDLRAMHGGRLLVETLDLAVAGEVRTVVDRAFDMMGRIDLDSYTPIPWQPNTEGFGPRGQHIDRMGRPARSMWTVPSTIR